MSRARNTAFENVEKTGLGSKVKNEIIQFMKKKEDQTSTIYEMINTLNIQHQTLTSQISLMADKGIIKEYSTTMINNTLYTVYKLVENPNEAELIKYFREHKKYMRWVRTGLNNFKEIMPKELQQSLKKIQIS